MADKILDVKIKQRYDTEANWRASDPVLLKGEIAISSDKNNQYKVGNGTSKWSTLSYASSSTSEKLTSARTITANGDMTGSFSFDGSANVSYNLYPYYSKIVVENKNNYPYHRFAYIDTITTSYTDKSSVFLITQDYSGGGWGIVKLSLRTNSTGATSTVSVEWLARKGLSYDTVQIGLYNVFGSTYADAFFKTQGAYASTVVRNMASGIRGDLGRTWTLINSSETNNTTESDSLTSVECYATIADAGIGIHEQEYSVIVSGTDSGIVSYANTAGSASSATSATSATKATQDSAGQQINTTYIKSITTSGKNLTYTKGNGSSTTVNTQSNLITLTKAQYDALVASGTVNEDNYYFITDDANTSPTLIQYITFAASGWTANNDSTTYTQTVTAEQISANDEPMIIKAKNIAAGVMEAKAYNKAFSLLCDGAGETGNGTVTWLCYKKPTTDITVGLIKVLA